MHSAPLTQEKVTCTEGKERSALLTVRNNLFLVLEMYDEVTCLLCGEVEFTHITDSEYVHRDIFGYSCLVCRMQDTFT